MADRLELPTRSAKPDAGKPAAGRAKAGAAKPAAGKPGRRASRRQGTPCRVEPAKLAMPKVVLSDAHAKTCLVKVGDALPDIAAARTWPARRSRCAALLGKRLTVVVFWQSDNSYAVEELADLEPDVGQAVRRRRGAGVAIDERDAADGGRRAGQAAGHHVSVLLDPTESAGQGCHRAGCRGRIWSTSRARSCGSTSNIPPAPAAICATRSASSLNGEG